jgi:hypothetical protein
MDATLAVHVGGAWTGVDPVLGAINETLGAVVAALPVAALDDFILGSEILAIASLPYGQRRAWLAGKPAWAQEALRDVLLNFPDPPTAVIQVIGTDSGPFAGGVMKGIRPRGARTFGYVVVSDIPGGQGEIDALIAERKILCSLGLLGLHASQAQEDAWEWRGMMSSPVTDNGASFDFIGSGLFTVLP